MSTPVTATTATTTVVTTVSSAAGGVGAAISDTTASYEVVLHNTGTQPVEYQLGAGSWYPLPTHSTATLAADLSATTIKLRKAADATANGSVTSSITALTGVYTAAGQTVLGT